MQPLEEILDLSTLYCWCGLVISVSWNKASVSVEVKNKSKAILVPLTSVVTENDKNYVWIVDEQKKSEEGRSYFGNADADNQEITSGLTDGAKVISNPTSSLEEGKVKADEETN